MKINWNKATVTLRPRSLHSYHTGSRCAAVGQTLCLLPLLFPHAQLHCGARCQVVGIHSTSLTHSWQLKNWQSGTHNQQRQSLLFPAEEEAERRWAEDMENSVTPSFTAATTATIITTTHMPVVWCGVVGVHVWRSHACGQLVFVFASKHPWIEGEGGCENSDWSQSFF